MLRRAIDYLVMPLGIATTVGLAAVVLALLFRRSKGRAGRRIAWWTGVAAVLVIYIASIRPTGIAMLAWIERPYPLVDPLDIEPVDAVFALGGAAEGVWAPDGALIVDPGPRFEAAMRLVNSGRARLIVVSRTGPKLPGESASESHYLKAEAMRRGLPDDRVVETEFVRTTGDEMRELARLAKHFGWKRVAIATDARHMGRALSLARAEGLDAVSFPSGRTAPPHPKPWPLHWLPTVDNLDRTTRAWHELLGRLVE